VVKRARDRRSSAMPSPDTLPRPWLASYPPGVPPTYDYPDVPLTRFLDDAARDFPEVSATIFSGESLSYADLLDRVDRLASALAERDVGPGSRAAIDLPPIPAAPIALFAALRLGAVVVAIPRGLDEAGLGRHLSETAATTLICLESEVGRLDGVRAELPRLRHVVVTGPDDWLPFAQRQLRRLRRSGRRERRRRAERETPLLSRLIEESEATAPQARLRRQDPALLVPNPVGDGMTALSHANLLAAAFQSRLWIPDMQAGRERVLVVDRIDTAPGLVVSLLAPVLSAASLLLVGAPKAEEALRAIDRLRPTIMPCSGDVCGEIAASLDGSRRDLTSVRVGLVGPPPAPIGAVETIEDHSEARLREFYGQAGAPFTHANPVYGRALRGGIGLPVTDTVAVIVDPEKIGRVLDPGEVGLLAIHGPQVVGEDDGWLVTEEPAVMEPTGYFRLLSEDG
jgi:long-chain acyl-CoA synthetase